MHVVTPIADPFLDREMIPKDYLGYLYLVFSTRWRDKVSQASEVIMVGGALVTFWGSTILLALIFRQERWPPSRTR